MDHNHSLLQKSVRALLWSGADAFVRQALQLTVAIVLARLLSPEEFGTIGLLYLFTGLSVAFIDSGFSTALIQCRDATHVDESTVFWFNLGMGLLVAGLLYGAAPSISDFYAQPILVPLTGILALSLAINALGGIHQTLLSKRLDFKTPMRIGVASTVASGLIAIALAQAGSGVWALAAQALVASVVNTSLLWVSSGWRPLATFSTASVRRLFGFGGYLMIAGLLDVAYSRAYSLFIGKLFGVRDLGLYNRADSTRQVPVEGLSGILARVAFPIFSAASSDKARLRRGVQYALRGIMLVNVPMMLGLMVTADTVLRVVFGEQWRPAAPILQILCLAGVFWPLHIINLDVLKAQGHAQLFFSLEVVKKIIGTTLLVLGLTQGLIGLAWSQVVFGFLAFLINAHYTRRFLDYGAWSQFLDFLPILMVSVGMAILVYFAGSHLNQPLPFILTIQVLLGVVVVLLVSISLPLRAFQDAVSLLNRRVKA